MCRAFCLILLIVGSIGAWAKPPRMVQVPPGELTPFWITPKEGADKAKVSGLSVMTAPVTNKDFQWFLNKRPEWRKSKVKKVFAASNYLDQFSADRELKTGVHAESPVTYVSWFAARAYCEDQGMRLPTFVEWEYLAAADDVKADATRDPEFLSSILEWYSEPRDEKGLKMVAQQKPNFYGVYDLHGLVWEWVEDFNSSLVTGESRDGGNLNRDLFCGSGAMAGGNKENYAAYMRFAFRSSLKGSSSTWNLGFRCVKGESI